MIRKMFLAVLVTSIFATSCSSDDDNNPSTSNLILSLNGLENLGDDFVYEGWIIVDGAPVSTGRFSSPTFPQTFAIDANQLAAATKFVLTIEPNIDSDPGPAATKILAGDFLGSSATVGLGPVAASGDFNDSWGKFFLRTNFEILVFSSKVKALDILLWKSIDFNFNFPKSANLPLSIISNSDFSKSRYLVDGKKFNQ